MFLSKLWFFVVGAIAVVAIGVALSLPRPAERQVLEAEDQRLQRARWEVEILLRENARQQVDKAMVAARGVQLEDTLAALVTDDKVVPVSAEVSSTARAVLREALDTFNKDPKRDHTDFLMVVDRKGRVVGRAGFGDGDNVYGDDLIGYFLVRDALRGYLRDDLWLQKGKLYRVAAAPILRESRYVGAIVVGDELDMALAAKIERRVSSRCGKEAEDGSRTCDTHVAFFAKGKPVASSDQETAPAARDIPTVSNHAEKAEKDAAGNVAAAAPVTLNAGDHSFRVATARLPGEVGAQDGFYAVYSERPTAVGFMGTLKTVMKSDISYAKFPWVKLGGGFLAVVVVGLLLMWLEHDRPLRRLTTDAVALGKGEKPKLAEDAHRGKHGAIARSVNISLEKLAREAKAGRRDLGALVDDEPIGGARPLPPVAPIGPGSPTTPFVPPPPSDFSLDGPRAAAGGHGGHSLPHGGGMDFDIPPPPPPSSAPPPPPPMASKPRAKDDQSQSGLKIASLMPPEAKPAPPPPPAAKPPAPPSTPPAAPRTTPAVPQSKIASLDDDILGDDVMPIGEQASVPVKADPTVPIKKPPAKGSDFGGETVVSGPSEELIRKSAEGQPEDEAAMFRRVYDDFIELKRKCGEPTEGLTYEKFSAKLRQNKEQLVTKSGAKAVKFQVYVKDGKAALKATPVQS